MQAHIADLRAALRTPMSELQALGQEFEAGEKGRRETQAVWRCAIGDACAAVDVVKNRWLTSRRKHEREAGAELSKLADLLWSVRSPAAGNYDEASIAGKRLIGLVRSNLIPSAPSGEG
ncbi:hypothetical protein [Sphingobium indicum]|uniref:Uncharacterized protein n=1 Tax=Sphingobium indicum (strain DSM 16412 / CCM 7286 / MTCC 6364 / B90A) TaxID=861109 RepID=A0A1L5BMP1_SPHIB|nr:hypothetical protein [Sphingobium indicum]APL94123.1 hypothetical protein SIDU_06155 [Sphingobium indicum B90A]